MKAVKLLIFFGLAVARLLCDPSPLGAQPASVHAPEGDAPDPADNHSIVIDGLDKPWSQGISIEDRTAARELFREGYRLSKHLLFTKAAEKFAAALEKWNHPAFYFNLALAQLAIGQEVEALANLERALAHGEEPLGATFFQEAQKQLEAVKHQLGRIRVTCTTPGAEVTLDGAALFTGPGRHEGWIKAKSHEITAKKGGYLSEARRVTITAGETHDINLNLVTLAQATDASRRWAAWKPWAVVAAGGAAVVAGGVVHSLSSRNFEGYDESFLKLGCVQMPDPVLPGCTEEQIPSSMDGQLTRARRQQTAAVGAYIVGGSLAAAGVVLLYLNRPQLVEQKASGALASPVAIVPVVSGDTFGIAVSVNH